MKGSLRNSIGSFTLALVILLFAAQAYADDCLALSGSPPSGGECKITTSRTVSGSFSLLETLHIFNGGKITVSPVATGLSIDITGSLIMNAGSEISGDLIGDGAGATITVNASSGMSLCGPAGAATGCGGPSANPGAFIHSNEVFGGACNPGAKGGDITLKAVGDFTQEDGSKIDSISNCGKGEIVIAGLSVNIDGEVLSKGTRTTARGGPITVSASCNLTESNSGTIVSIGLDAGADRVHLQGGCAVTIYGLVASTAPGHTVPATNKCVAPERPDKPSNSTACVEIWAGDSIVIDSRPLHNGEVQADTAQSGGTKGLGWIDLYARGPITINGDTATPFAVHANQYLNSGHGGLITVKSIQGGVTALGFAIQASDTLSAGQGGSVTVQAKLDVNLNNGEIEAAGNASGGPKAHGGSVAIRSFGTAPATGSILVNAPFMLDVTGDTPPDGTVDLKACGPIGFPPGTVVPAGASVSIATPVCGSSPALPGYVTLPQCSCAPICVP